MALRSRWEKLGAEGGKGWEAGLRDGWILPHPWAEGPLACYRLMAFTIERSNAWRW